MLDRAADARADQQHHGREGDVGEARDDERERRDAQELGRAPPEDEQADEAADPDRAGGEVEPVEGQREAAGSGLRLAFTASLTAASWSMQANAVRMSWRR